MKLSELQQQKKKALVLFSLQVIRSSTLQFRWHWTWSGRRRHHWARHALLRSARRWASNSSKFTTSNQKRNYSRAHLGQVKEIRKHTNIPLVLMGYLNPILHYGEERFFADAANVGVDGVILPEVPAGRVQIVSCRSLANIILLTFFLSVRLRLTNEFARSIKSHQGFSIVSLRQASPALKHRRYRVLCETCEA